MQRQRVFWYQVQRHVFIQDRFLERALERYKRFLYIIQYQWGKGNLSIPMYDIDLLWHAHQMHPREYAKDTIALVGAVIKHDDTINDRSAGATLEVNFHKTIDLYTELFGEPYVLAGTAYRGDPKEDAPAPPPFGDDGFSYSFKMPDTNYEDKAMRMDERAGLVLPWGGPPIAQVVIEVHTLDAAKTIKTYSGNRMWYEITRDVDRRNSLASKKIKGSEAYWGTRHFAMLDPSVSTLFISFKRSGRLWGESTIGTCSVDLDKLRKELMWNTWAPLKSSGSQAEERVQLLVSMAPHFNGKHYFDTTFESKDTLNGVSGACEAPQSYLKRVFGSGYGATAAVCL
mmetsp:Transcript_22878/g.35813  ORF Transcript_22878/g.35813 Transcript_22878/m.35813 type:complete len:342 (+) Transcript_22878:829-1854(+)